MDRLPCLFRICWLSIVEMFSSWMLVIEPFILVLHFNLSSLDENVLTFPGLNIQLNEVLSKSLHSR